VTSPQRSWAATVSRTARLLDCGYSDTQRLLSSTGNSMRESEANTFARSRSKMYPLWISLDKRCHLTACVSDQRGRHLTVDMV